VHQVDVVGPCYLKGDKTRYYFLVCKDVFDQAVYLELLKGRSMDGVLTFLIHAWKFWLLGTPPQSRHPFMSATGDRTDIHTKGQAPAQRFGREF
jgi:hypothetical protein